MTVRKVGVVVGSNRKGSVNAKLARALMKLAPKQLDVRFCASTICPYSIRITIETRRNRWFA